MRFTDIVLHRYRQARVLTGLTVAALAMPGLLMTSAATASTASTSTAAGTMASNAARTATATTYTAKLAPARPPSSPGAGTGAAIPAKPHGRHENRPLSTWTATLTASPGLLWPTQDSTLTATANMDVGPTPYYLRIYDLTAGAYVVTCASGTTCTTPVTQPAPATHLYEAVISYPSAYYPPSGQQAASGETGVTWQGVNLTLVASAATVPVGGVSTLTATTSLDIGPSPFSIEIFDATTGTWITGCGYGTTCTATVSQNAATTQEYIAYLAPSAAYPPTGIQATSLLNPVTWSDLGWQVTLSAPASTYSSETVTAAANGDVGPTPYFIEIFDEATGTRLAVCGSGITCSMTFTPSNAGSNLVAFVSGDSTALPPSGTVASSSVITSYLRIIP